VALGGPRLSWIAPLLAVAAALDRRTRRLGLPLLLGVPTAIVLVSFNATARFQNFRYAAPALLMLLAGAGLGAGAIARRGRGWSAAAAAAIAAATIAPLPRFPRQIEHFAQASANIAGQQVVVARRLAARAPSPRRVLVGDAGAIPYLSGLGAIDGLGLGGYRGLPFARASVHGAPAVVELIERLPPAERPDVLALYPSWWIGLADVFGRRAFGVRIEGNVICAADEKVVYDADWSPLAAPRERRDAAVDELDVGDLVDERAHAYSFPGPRGGWVIGRVLQLADGTPRFDAGRIVPEGKDESFTILHAGAESDGSAGLVLRTDGEGEPLVRVSIERAGRVSAIHEAALPPRPLDRWFELRVPLGDVRSGDRIRVSAVRGAWRGFHAWVIRE
jgi:hypothetical protein